MLLQPLQSCCCLSGPAKSHAHGAHGQSAAVAACCSSSEQGIQKARRRLWCMKCLTLLVSACKLRIAASRSSLMSSSSSSLCSRKAAGSRQLQWCQDDHKGLVCCQVAYLGTATSSYWKSSSESCSCCSSALAKAAASNWPATASSAALLILQVACDGQIGSVMLAHVRDLPGCR